MAERYDSEWPSSGMVKVFYDGVLDSWTAVMVEPYADRPDWVGEPLFTPQQFIDLAVAIDKRGLQIAVHSIGDGAVRAVLDGYEAAQKANGKRDSRHRVEHIEVTTAADVPRFAELGVIASMQPSHPPGAMDFPLEPTVSRIGPDRWPLSYAWRTLKEAGAHVVFASDWPVAAIDPILSIQAAFAAQTHGQKAILTRVSAAGGACRLHGRAPMPNSPSIAKGAETGPWRIWWFCRRISRRRRRPICTKCDR